MAQPVVHWEIMAKDFPKSRDFYAKLFDWTMHAFTPEYALVEADGEKGIGGGILQAPSNMLPSITFYAHEPDADDADADHCSNSCDFSGLRNDRVSMISVVLACFPIVSMNSCRNSCRPCRCESAEFRPHFIDRGQLGNGPTLSRC